MPAKGHFAPETFNAPGVQTGVLAAPASDSPLNCRYGTAAGTTRFWVRIDSGGAVADSDEGDNVTSGEVRIRPFGALLPFTFRQ
jgi:hypothetical protein